MPAVGQFTVTFAGVATPVGIVSILDVTNGGVTTSVVRLNLSVVAGPDEAVTVAYAKPAANPIEDTSGNDAPAFAATSVTNNSAWSTVTIASAIAVRNSRVRLTMSDAIIALDPAENRLTVTAGGTGRTPTTSWISKAGNSPADPGIVILTGFNPPIAKGDTVTVSYSPAFTATLNGSRLVDSSLNPIPAVSNLSATNNAAELIQSAVAVGNKVTLTYSGNLGTMQTPDHQDWSTHFGEDFANNNAVTAISVSGSTVTLTVLRPYEYGENVAVGYTSPGDTTSLLDADGKEIDNLTNYPVTNNTPAAVEFAEAKGKALVLEYQGPLCATTVADVCTAHTLDGSEFTVTAAGSARTVTGASVDGSTVTLIHGTTDIGPADAVTVAYTKPSTNALQDGNGNELDSFTARKVDNVSRLLVRNSRQEQGTDSSVTFDFAQAFTTGSSAFKLTRADLWLAKIAGAGTLAYTLSIHRSGSDGRPGAALGSLTTSDAPALNVHARHEFAASGTGIDLDGDTTYFAVVDVSTPSNRHFVGQENSTAEDAGAAPGWSLADTLLRRGHLGTLWSGAAEQSKALRIALHGHSTDTAAPALVASAQTPLAVNGNQLTLTYNENLDPGSVPNVSRFSVSVAGGAAANPTAVRVSGKTVTLTLAAAVGPDDAVTLAYDRPIASENPLRDFAAPHFNLAPAFTATTVTNITPRGVVPTVRIASNGNISAGSPARFTVSASTAPSSNLDISLVLSQTGGVITPWSGTVRIAASTTSATFTTAATSPGNSGTVTVNAGTGYQVHATAFSATATVTAGGTDPPGSDPPGTDPEGGTEQRPRNPVPLQLALWTDAPAYRAGDTVRLYRTLDPHDDRGQYRAFAYLEKAGGGERRWLAPLSAEATLHPEAVDHRGRPADTAPARSLPAADRKLAYEGEAPSPGLWQFVLELRPGSADEQYEDPDEPMQTRRAWARFLVAERAQLINRAGFHRELRADATLRSGVIYYLGHQLSVRDGVTLTLEAGTLVRAWGRDTAIIVEPGGRIVAEGTPEAPIVLGCSARLGLRQPGCWGGLRILGRAPVTRLQGEAPNVLPPGLAAYGGTDAEDSSGVLRYVRVEFAGAAGDEEGAAGPAIGLYGTGSGTVLDHVQAHASLGDGFAFSGGTAACDHCVASGSGQAGLSWERGWRGGAAHLYVHHGDGGVDGLVGANDEEGYDLEPRSLPALSNVTLVHAQPYGKREREGIALDLSTGSGVRARDLLAIRFQGGAVRATARTVLLFEDGESAIASSLLHFNGHAGRRQLRGGLDAGIEFLSKDPKLRDVRDFPNPDPRPKADSPALPEEGDGYIGAFGPKENWLEGWTVFGPESAYEPREETDDDR